MFVVVAFMFVKDMSWVQEEQAYIYSYERQTTA
jgi:hypothetical protein